MFLSPALLILSSDVRGQSIAERIAAAPDGKVRMSFAARSGVCGDGRSMISFGGSRVWVNRDDDWESDCDDGPVRVQLRVRDGQAFDIDTYVGGRWRPSGGVSDLGPVSAPGAAQYFLSLARRAAGNVGEDAVLPAMLADSVTVWPDLLELARDDDAPRATRKRAVFWLGQAAGERLTAELGELAADETGDREIREHAIFALSQRPHHEGIPALIRIARTSPDHQLRKKALFWLGQSGDPRAIDLFEEILFGN